MKPKLAGAFTNLGNLKYQAGQNEDACYEYLAALDIDCDDSETLANLGMALAQTKYRDYASIAFEEALAAGYGNLNILNNYLYFLLEDQQFEKFNSVSKSAQRVMEDQEFKALKQLAKDYMAAAKEAGQLKNEPKKDSAAPSLATLGESSPAGESSFARRLS